MSNNLAKIAQDMRRLSVEGIFRAQSGHPGGSLSICDILAVLFFEEMNVSKDNSSDPNRDRFVLSKGHAAPAYYAALALKGFFSTEEMKKLRKIDSFLQGHPCRNKVPEVDMSTGSLGQGLSAANGMAMMAKYDKRNYRVYVIAGDGEIQEGQIWEAAMTAAHYKLDNLVLFVDVNGLQIDGTTDEIMCVGDVGTKFDAFGWNVIRIDGNNFDEIRKSLLEAKHCKGIPTVVVAQTIKGKGVSYMENQVGFHGAAPSEEQYNIAMNELSKEVTE